MGNNYVKECDKTFKKGCPTHRGTALMCFIFKGFSLVRPFLNLLENRSGRTLSGPWKNDFRERRISLRQIVDHRVPEALATFYVRVIEGVLARVLVLGCE